MHAGLVYIRNNCLVSVIYRWFSRYVTAAMLVHIYKKNLMNLFCYVHQHGRHGLCHLGPTGLKVTVSENHI